jgi:hypothetical protein
MIPNHIEYCINNYIADKYTDYQIETIIPGHFGYKNIMKNPVFKISSYNNDVVYLLYCENSCVCELDDKSYMILMSYKYDYKTKNDKNITFYKSGNGYIYASNKILPVGINHSDMPKYVYYCTERRNKGKYNEHVREFFRIEKHPHLQKIGKKCITSSKSCAINIHDKLTEITNKLKHLDNEHQNYLNGPTID